MLAARDGIESVRRLVAFNAEYQQHKEQVRRETLTTAQGFALMRQHGANHLEDAVCEEARIRTIRAGFALD